MDYLPIFLDVKGKKCLVIGGGEVSLRKTSLLVQAGALVTIVSPELNPALTGLAGTTHIAERYKSSHLDDHILVIAATDEEETNSAVSKDAKQRNIPVNVVDRDIALFGILGNRDIGFLLVSSRDDQNVIIQVG